MAEHGTVEYATATGNDYPVHEGTYERFVHFTFVGIIFVVDILFGLAVGGVMGDWFMAAVVFLLAVFGFVAGLFGSSRMPSLLSFLVCFLIFAFAGLS